VDPWLRRSACRQGQPPSPPHSIMLSSPFGGPALSLFDPPPPALNAAPAFSSAFGSAPARGDLRQALERRASSLLSETHFRPSPSSEDKCLSSSLPCLFGWYRSDLVAVAELHGADLASCWWKRAD
jgi:hypothetical protein